MLLSADRSYVCLIIANKFLNVKLVLDELMSNISLKAGDRKASEVFVKDTLKFQGGVYSLQAKYSPALTNCLK